MNKHLLLLAAASLVCSGATAHAQFIEDAVRLAQTNGMVSARAGALGPAYSGISDDFAALYYNPAGLTLQPKRELTLGLQLYRNQNTADYLSLTTRMNGNSEAISSIGFVSPLRFGSTKAALALGYTLESDFDDDYKVVGRGRSSIAGAWTASGAWPNRAYELYLADSIGGRLVTPVGAGLHQSSTVLESGGLHAISGALAFDIAENVSVGVTIHGKWGNYSYDRRYTELDDQNRYNELDTANFSTIDLHSITVRETLDQDISGIGATFGVLGRIGEYMRFGISVHTPSYYSITEDFAESAEVVYDNEQEYSYPAQGGDPGRNSYSVTTPFVFNTGMSFHMAGLTVAGSVEYSDLSQVEFSSSLVDIEDLNIDIAEQLTGQLVWGLGAEYENELLPVVFRAGISNGTSIYTTTPDEESFTVFTAGAGLYLASNIRVDAMYGRRTTSYRRVLYDAEDAAYTVDRASSQFALQFTYRY